MNRTVIKLALPALAVLSLAGCAGDPNSPGVEYMPDMYRSPAIEAYVDYEDPEYLSARLPVPGTVPFGMDSMSRINNLPYAYPDTPEGFEAATTGLKNPLSLTQRNLDEAKILYAKFCTHCHGAEGNGNGKMVENGKFPPPPAYNAIPGLTEGRAFHSISYGKGLMGPHAPLLNKVERWKLVQYVMQLAAGNTTGKLATDSTATKAMPADSVHQQAAAQMNN